MHLVRYEILLPRRFDDGTAVPDDLLEVTREELLSQFDGVTVEPTVLYGTWIHQGVRYQDEVVRVYVECEDTRANERLFRSLKETLKDRFQQLDIRLTSHRIKVY